MKGSESRLWPMPSTTGLFTTHIPSSSAVRHPCVSAKESQGEYYVKEDNGAFLLQNGAALKETFGPLRSPRLPSQPQSLLKRNSSSSPVFSIPKTVDNSFGKVDHFQREAWTNFAGHVDQFSALYSRSLCNRSFF